MRILSSDTTEIRTYVGTPRERFGVMGVVEVEKSFGLGLYLWSFLRKQPLVDINKILELNLLIPLTEKGRKKSDARTMLVILSQPPAILVQPRI